MNSNLVCLCSDFHFGVKKNSEIYFRNQKNFIVNQFVPYLKENKIKRIFILGDVFDNRSSINTKIQNEVFNIFNDYFKDFEIFILVGNHDCYFNSTINVNSIKFLGKFENITIVEENMIIENNGKKILLTPWIVNFSDFIDYISDKEFDVSFGHYNVKGFHYNKYKTSEDGLDGSLFGNKCKKVFSGHFHIRSKQTFKDCEIIYIGSPYQITRNDRDEERGFVILNTDDLTYEHIDNTISMKFIKLQFPQKFTRQLINGNIIDVHVKYDKNYSEEKVDKYIKRIIEYQPAFEPVIAIETDDMLNAGLDLNLNLRSIPDLIREYIDTIEMRNKDDVYQILIDLYDETK